MSDILLYSRAEATLRGLHLNAHDSAFVKSCISNYTLPWDFSVLHWIVYRIANVIKGHFGDSDWDLAKTLVQNRARELANAQGLLSPQAPEPSPYSERIIDLQRRVTEVALESADYLSVSILELAFYQNEVDTTQSFIENMNSIPIIGQLFWDKRPAIDQPNSVPLDLERQFNEIRMSCFNILDGMHGGG